MSTFKIGDVVRLRKGGGPAMVVSYLYESEPCIDLPGSSTPASVDCCWFDDQQHLQRAGFCEQILVLAADDPSPKAKEQLVFTGKGTFTDSFTGLEWQLEDDGVRRSHAQAQAYVKELRLAGYSDWRLPSRTELLSLVDDAAYKPATLGGLCAHTKSEWYWSSTPDASLPVDYAWGVNFNSGNTYLDDRDDGGFVRAVRSVAGAASPGQ